MVISGKISHRSLVVSVVGIVYSIVFLLLQGSPYADIFSIKLIFRDIILPAYQWALTLIFIAALRYVAREPWKKACAYGIILGFLLDMYPAMLDTQKQVWAGVRISGVYVLYINIFVFVVTSCIVVWGAYIIVSMFLKRESVTVLGKIAFLPVSLLALYAIFFYYRCGHIGTAIALDTALIISLCVMIQKNPIPGIRDAFARAVKWLSREDRLLKLIFILAFVARVVFLINLLRIEGPRYPLASDDGDAYNAWGLKGAADPMSFLRESPHQWMLFYSVLISAVYKVFGHSYMAIGIVQSAIGALLCCAVFVLSKRITGSVAVSFLAALGAASDTALIHLTATLNTEALYIPLITLTILFLLFYRECAKDLKAIAFLLLAGISLALATIMRMLGLVLIIFALPWIAIWGRVYGRGLIMKRLRDAALFVMITFLAIAPITCVNYINTHKFVLVYRTGSLLWACGSAAWGEQMVPSNKRLIELGMRDPVTDFGGSVRAVLAKPKDILIAYGRIVPKRLRNLYLWPKFGSFDPVFLMNSSQCPNRYASKLEFYSILILFASFFVFIFSKRKTYLKVLALLVIMFYTFFHGILFLTIGPRYGAPMRPFLYIIMSFCVYTIWVFISSALKNAKEKIA